MYVHSRHITFVVLVSVLQFQLTLSSPMLLLVDSDIGPGVDDVGALAVIHTAILNGEAMLLAEVCCTTDEWGAPALDVISTYFDCGNNKALVGTSKREDSFLEGPQYEKYNKYLAQNFPNSVGTGLNASDATAVYRGILASVNTSTTFIAIGPLGNLATLLQSAPDDISPLSGSELVSRSVSLLVIMGGAYPQGVEWNLEQDPSAAATVAEYWPTPIVWSGYEVGATIFTGSVLTNAPEDDPVRVAYDLYVGDGNSRPSWDLTAAYYALWPQDYLFQLSAEGVNTINQTDGSNVFTSVEGGGQWYLIKNASDDAIADTLNDLIVTAPVC